MYSIAKCCKVIDHFEGEGKGGMGLEFWGKNCSSYSFIKKTPPLINKTDFQIELLILLAA